MKSFEFSTPEWAATAVPECGGNLIRLFHKPTGTEILRTPENEGALQRFPDQYGLPVLFPPNRIDEGRFFWRGREYMLPINEPKRNCHLHGLALGKPWQVLACQTTGITMSFSHAATPGFPHDFTLVLAYAFSSGEVEQELQVYNNSPDPMPFGVGFHSAFILPATGRVRITAADGYWQILRPRFLPDGKLIGWRGQDPVFTDQDDVSLHCPITTSSEEGRPFRGAIMERPQEHVRVLYQVDEKYRHWCLWNKEGGQGFFCAEPMSCMVNAPNLALPPQTTGLQELQPGACWRARSTFSVQRTPASTKQR